MHRLKNRFMRDLEKYNRLAMMDWRLLRVTPEMVRSGEALQWVKEFVE